MDKECAIEKRNVLKQMLYQTLVCNRESAPEQRLRKTPPRDPRPRLGRSRRRWPDTVALFRQQRGHQQPGRAWRQLPSNALYHIPGPQPGPVHLQGHPLRRFEVSFLDVVVTICRCWSSPIFTHRCLTHTRVTPVFLSISICITFLYLEILRNFTACGKLKCLVG